MGINPPADDVKRYVHQQEKFPSGHILNCELDMENQQRDSRQ